MTRETIAAAMHILGVTNAPHRAVDRLLALEGAEISRHILVDDGESWYWRYLDQQEAAVERHTYWHERKESSN